MATKRQAGKEEAEAEIYFSSYGTMYKKNHMIPTDGSDGFRAHAYYYADKMETVAAPNMQAMWTAFGNVFQNCTALKTASLPKIMRIGLQYFSGCTALEEISLGCTEFPMVSIGATALRDCSALVRFNYIGTIPSAVSFAQSPLLNDASIQTIVDCLADLAGQTAQTLTLHATVGAKLTDRQKEIIATKNWTLVY